MNHPLANLEDFVCEHFTVDELRPVVGALPEGSQLLKHVPRDLSLARFVSETVRAISRRKLVTPFMLELRSRRPRAAQELAEIEHALRGTETETGRLREHILQELGAERVQPYPHSLVDTLVVWERGRTFLLWAVVDPDCVKLEDLRYAFTCELPVLLVHGHEGCEGWMWADQALHAKATTHAGETIQLSFGRNEECLEHFIERTIATHERPRWGWEPDAWGRLQDWASKLGRKIRELGDEAECEELLESLDAAARSVEDARFIVVIAGPYRAGKSTLINALLGCDISPVSRRPTTAVAVEFEAGLTGGAEVFFADGNSQRGPATREFLARFATQDTNPNNQQNVNYVRVRVESPLLAQGVTLLDAPGLQDPNEMMVRIAKEACNRAHAVLYVVDGAPFRSGGFVLNGAVIDDLRRLGSRSAGPKLALLVNKSDVLEPGQREELSELLQEQLANTGVDELLLQSPCFVSARRAWEAQAPEQRERELEKLHTILWNKLLQHGEIGFRQLRASLRGLEQAALGLQTLLASRRKRGAEAKSLQTWVEDARISAEELRHSMTQSTRNTELRASAQLREGTQHVVRQLCTELGRISVEQSLPSASQIARRLENSLEEVARAAWNSANFELRELSQQAERVIEAELRQARVAATALVQSPSISMPRVNINFSADTGIRLGLGGGVLGGVVSLLLGAAPWAAVFSGIGGFFSMIFSSRDKRRKQDLCRLTEQIEEQGNRVCEDLCRELRKNTNARLRAIEQRVEDRLGAFVDGVEDRIRAANAAPLDDEQQRRIAGLEQRAQQLRTEICALFDEVFRVGMAGSGSQSDATS